VLTLRVLVFLPETRGHGRHDADQACREYPEQFVEVMYDTADNQRLRST